MDLVAESEVVDENAAFDILGGNELSVDDLVAQRSAVDVVYIDLEVARGDVVEPDDTFFALFSSSGQRAAEEA